PSGKLLGRFPRAAGQAPAAFSPDRTILVAEDFAADNFAVDNLWAVDTGKKLRPLELPRQGGNVIDGYGFTLRADGKTLAKRDYTSNLILLWHTDTGKLLHRFEAHAYPVEQVVVSPDGRTLASRAAMREPEFRLWELSSGKPLRAYPGWSAGLAFAPDGQTLFSAGERISAWETGTGKEVSRFKSAPRGVYFASRGVSADGRVLAAGDRQGRASLWGLSTGKALRQLQVHPVYVDPDGETSSPAVIPLAFSPDGRALIFGNDYDQITIASAVTGTRLHQFKNRCTLRALALSPDGKTLASTGPSNAQVIHLWELATGKERLQIGDKRDSFYSVAFSADGKTLISGGQQTIRFWDTATGKEVGQLQGHRGPVTALTLLPDGRGFVSGSADTTVLVWKSIARKAEKTPPAKLTDVELEALWADLAGDDAAKAFRAIHRLAAAATQAVPFLRPRLVPVSAPDPEHLTQLIADLDSAEFAVRQRATGKLEKLAELAGPALRKAVDDKRPSLEVQRRINRLLARIEELALPAGTLRPWRAIETLEAIGTPEARPILQTLASGAAGARITLAASDALKRWDRLGRVKP